mmetsp:Transcript_141808/g.440906  ORF Transcript_141808/g.440906 Transcript_141808/m.440906 type:complete len:299 (+) Transcript_141808:1-897(+)
MSQASGLAHVTATTVLKIGTMARAPREGSLEKCHLVVDRETSILALEVLPEPRQRPEPRVEGLEELKVPQGGPEAVRPGHGLLLVQHLPDVEVGGAGPPASKVAGASPSEPGLELLVVVGERGAEVRPQRSLELLLVLCPLGWVDEVTHLHPHGMDVEENLLVGRPRTCPRAVEPQDLAQVEAYSTGLRYHLARGMVHNVWKLHERVLLQKPALVLALPLPSAPAAPGSGADLVLNVLAVDACVDADHAHGRTKAPEAPVPGGEPGRPHNVQQAWDLAQEVPAALTCIVGGLEHQQPF